jgi:hypothetical protein
MRKDLPGTPTIPVLSTGDKLLVISKMVLPDRGKIWGYQ